jgi:hypothetical protein
MFPSLKVPVRLEKSCGHRSLSQGEQELSMTGTFDLVSLFIDQIHSFMHSIDAPTPTS